MVKSAAERQGSTVAPFVKKLYEMVDDDATNSIIAWSPTEDSFTIVDITQFCVHMLPKYFKHSNFSSFMRQLNIYVSFFFLLFLYVFHHFFFLCCGVLIVILF